MSERSEIVFARCADGGHIAYRVIGSGPLQVLEVGGFGTVFSIEASDDFPQARGFEDDLGRFCRLIRFDPRGVGGSDPRADALTTELWVEDLLTVMDAVGVEDVALLASGFGGSPALALAARHPQRVSSVVLVNSSARTLKDYDYDAGVPPEVFDKSARTADPEQGQVSEIEVMAPSLAGDADLERWWRRESRRGATPATAASFWTWIREIDVRDDARQIARPTLVVSTRDNEFIRPGRSTWLAANVPGAQHLMVEGADHVTWAISAPRLLPSIEEFLTGARSRTAARGVFVAVLFTDIVDSTTTNTREGNRAWLQRLARHDDAVARQIRHYGGTQIKNMGDGTLAIFATPSLAIESARGIQTAAAEMGLDVRAAIHTAEVERRDGDVLGLGVTIAARSLGHANGGQVVVTSTVTQALTGSGHTFTPLGQHSLKGIPGEWSLYALRDGHQAGSIAR